VKKHWILSIFNEMPWDHQSDHQWCHSKGHNQHKFLQAIYPKEHAVFTSLHGCCSTPSYGSSKLFYHTKQVARGIIIYLRCQHVMNRYTAPKKLRTWLEVTRRGVAEMNFMKVSKLLRRSLITASLTMMDFLTTKGNAVPEKASCSLARNSSNSGNFLNSWKQSQKKITTYLVFCVHYNPPIPLPTLINTTTVTQIFATSSVVTESSTKWCWPLYGIRRSATR